MKWKDVFTIVRKQNPWLGQRYYVVNHALKKVIIGTECPQRAVELAKIEYDRIEKELEKIILG